MTGHTGSCKIAGHPVTLTDYQVRFTVWNRTGVDNGENVYLGAKVNQDYTDLRFTGLNNAQLSYWIRSQ